MASLEQLEQVYNKYQQYYAGQKILAAATAYKAGEFETASQGFEEARDSFEDDKNPTEWNVLEDWREQSLKKQEKSKAGVVDILDVIKSVTAGVDSDIPVFDSVVLTLGEVKELCPGCYEEVKSNVIPFVTVGELVEKKIGKKPEKGFFRRCVGSMSKRKGVQNPNNLCAYIHKRVYGTWPAEKEEESVTVQEKHQPGKHSQKRHAGRRARGSANLDFKRGSSLYNKEKAPKGRRRNLYRPKRGGAGHYALWWMSKNQKRADTRGFSDIADGVNNDYAMRYDLGRRPPLKWLRLTDIYPDARRVEDRRGDYDFPDTRTVERLFNAGYLTRDSKANLLLTESGWDTVDNLKGGSVANLFDEVQSVFRQVST